MAPPAGNQAPIKSTAATSGIAADIQMDDFLLTHEERERLEKLAQTDDWNIRIIADGLKGHARDVYLMALKRRKGHEPRQNG